MFGMKVPLPFLAARRVVGCAVRLVIRVRPHFFVFAGTSSSRSVVRFVICGLRDGL